jgi:hypothetical protein
MRKIPVRQFMLLLCLLCAGFSTCSQAQGLLEETRTYLNAQWNDSTGAGACLDALEAYTSSDSSGALKELLKGAPKQIGNHSAAAVYGEAAKRNDFWYMVATSTGISANPELVKADGNPASTPDEMFASAGKAIGSLFSDTDNGLTALARARDAANSADGMKALYRLLKAVPTGRLQEMKCYRACYRQDPAKLFQIVNELFTK